MATAMGWRHELSPGLALRSIVRQATAALITMDADRLEELAQCCMDLNRDRTGNPLPNRNMRRDMPVEPASIADAGLEPELAAGIDLALAAAAFQADPSTGPELERELKVLERVLFESHANLRVFSALHRKRIASVHGWKGLEADTFLLDRPAAREGNYGND